MNYFNNLTPKFKQIFLKKIQKIQKKITKIFPSS